MLKTMKMKKSISGTILLLLGANAVMFAQDPLAGFTIQRDLAKIEASLSTAGKALLASEKRDYDRLKTKSYMFGPNRCMNYPLSSLASLIAEDMSPTLIKKNNESNLAKLPTLKREFEAKGIRWNPAWLIDLRTIDWGKILMGASGCTLNTSILSPVKDQGACGSCWSFAAGAVYEHGYKLTFGGVKDISEQDILSCGINCSSDNAGSCSGGWEFRALDYMLCTGVASEAVYPYTNAGSTTEAACLSKAKSSSLAGWIRIGESYPSDDIVKCAIATYGAVTTAVYARGWSGYGGGVMDAYPNGSPELVSSTGATINHAVTIVGWCDAKGAWIVKNSWGADWGPHRGYCYVKYGHYNINNRVYAALPNP